MRNLIVTKLEKNQDYFSLLIKDKRQKLEFWFDIALVDKDLIGEFNQYIFFLLDPNHVKMKNYQEKPNNLGNAFSKAIEYLENENLIYQDEQGNWFLK